MKKNVILDVGMVLVDFCWQETLNHLQIVGDDFEAVANATVRSPEWGEYDRSVYSDEEILRIFKQKAPDHEAQIQLFWDHTSDTIRQYPYAKPWITALKAAGYSVYILSNYSKRTYTLTRENGLDFLPLADGAVFSFEVGYVKPEKEIYHVIMDKYGLEPEECVFVDDNLPNLVYPKEIGWGTVAFHDFAQVQAELKEQYGIS